MNDLPNNIEVFQIRRFDGLTRRLYPSIEHVKAREREYTSLVGKSCLLALYVHEDLIHLQDHEVSRTLLELIKRPSLQQNAMKSLTADRSGSAGRLPAAEAFPDLSFGFRRDVRDLSYSRRKTKTRRLGEMRCPKALDWIFGIRSLYLGKSVDIALHMTYGAGGYAIGTVLNYCAIVPCDSPAFRLFNNWRSRERTQAVEAVTALLQGTLRKFEILFKKERYHPQTLSTLGETCSIKPS